MGAVDQSDIDARIQVYYGDLFDEDARLTTRSPQGPLEFQRTQEVIRLNAPVGRLLDIGGGTGVHSRALLAAGYDVELIEPVQRHVEAARDAGIDAQLGDARDLPVGDASFGAALLLGPLYHLASAADRQQALSEAARVLRPGGMLFAAGLSRHVAFAGLSLGQTIPEQIPDDWSALFVDGAPSRRLRFPAGHYHTADELQDEVSKAGFEVLDVIGVEGPAGPLLEAIPDASQDLSDAALEVARAASSVPGIREQSAHLLAIGRSPA
jgi:SAM-dependent methyltransferase